jgi:hypothetical protein
MGAHDKAGGGSPAKRKNILTDLGFQFHICRPGGGGHEVWIHPEIIKLAETYEIEVPANRKVRGTQALGHLVVVRDPKPGAWGDTLRYAEWCRDTVAEINEKPDSHQKKSEEKSVEPEGSPRQGQFGKAAAYPGASDQGRSPPRRSQHHSRNRGSAHRP